jgi:hypothetical protein
MVHLGRQLFLAALCLCAGVRADCRTGRAGLKAGNASKSICQGLAKSQCEAFHDDYCQWVDTGGDGPGPAQLSPILACGGGEANIFYGGTDVFTSADSCNTCARSCANAGGAAWDYFSARPKPCHCKAAGFVKQSAAGHVGGVCQAPPTPACGGGEANVFYVGTDIFTSTDSCDTCASSCRKAGGAAWDFESSRPKPCHCKEAGFVKTKVAGHVGGVLQPSPSPATGCGGGEANIFYSGADVLLSTDSCETCANTCAMAGAAAWDYLPDRSKPCHCKTEDYSKGAVTGHVGGALKPPRAQWPTFANAADLSASPWGTYFKAIYGSLPSSYPLAVADFWTIDGTVAVANGVSLPAMQVCPATFSLDGTPYSINNLYQPHGFSWIWHRPPYSAFASHEWVEVMHEADPWGDEQHGAWMVYAKGSGIWYNLGNTIVFQEHSDAAALFGTADNPTMSQRALAAGYDSLQFLAHNDPVQYPCDINHHPEERYAAPTYLNVEIVCTACVGTFACMGSGGAPSSVRAGWLGSSPCSCSNGKKHLNCNGFGANASFRISADKFFVEREHARR